MIKSNIVTHYQKFRPTLLKSSQTVNVKKNHVARKHIK